MILQGILSFMSDVYCYGRYSHWKVADAISATSGAITGLTVPILQLAGVFTFPLWMMLPFAVAMIGGVYTKVRSSALLREGRVSDSNPEPWIRWHMLWHLVMPMGASACLTSLLLV